MNTKSLETGRLLSAPILTMYCVPSRATFSSASVIWLCETFHALPLMSAEGRVVHGTTDGGAA